MAGKSPPVEGSRAAGAVGEAPTPGLIRYHDVMHRINNFVEARAIDSVMVLLGELEQAESDLQQAERDMAAAHPSYGGYLAELGELTRTFVDGGRHRRVEALLPGVRRMHDRYANIVALRRALGAGESPWGD